MSLFICAIASYPEKGTVEMISNVKVKAIYNCSIERAFKTPMLCDISKVHTGFGFIPKVTHCTEDENWGKPGCPKKVFTTQSIFRKGGWFSNDQVIERIENEYWKIEVSNFQSWNYGFSKFVGMWKTIQLGPNKILIEYSYELHSGLLILYPFHWIFTKTIWRSYMRQVISNIRKLAYDNEPYLFD